MKRRGFCGLLLVLATATSQRAVVRASNGVSDSFGALAPAFVANPDSESEASLISVGGGRPIFFTRHDVRIVDPAAARSLWLSFVSTDEPVVSGDHPTGGRVAFVRRPATIVRPAYHEVVYRGLWTGIDARITGEGGGLEYAFEIAAGANPGAIRLRYLGVDRMRLEANGDLALAADGQTIVDRAPIAYQLVRGRRQSVPVRFALRESKVTFEVGDYDRARPLVIDPTLIYSTYLGSSGTDKGNAIAVDASGAAYVAGSSAYFDLPVTPGAYQTTWNGDPNTVLPDAFVAKIDPSGTQFQYVTYLGGTNADEATGIAIDGGGNAYITGSTRSPDFPTTLGAFRTTIGRGQDGFVAKLNATGTALVYSTFLGADGLSRSNAVGVDGSGNAYIAGQTNGNSLPLAGNTPTSPWDHAFVMKFDASGSSLLFGTWIGGYGPDAATGIAVTGDGTAYVAGYTHSVDGIAAPSTSGGSPYQPLPNGPTFKSTDGGQTFTNVNTAVSTRGSAGFAIDPTDPSTVYQATLDTGVLKTTDGGADWTIPGATPGPTKSIRDVAVNPATPSVLLATSVDNGNIGPIWRSTDGAATWTEVAPFGTFVAFAPSNPFIAYAMHSGGIFKSVDAGATWTQVYAAPSGTPLYSIGVDPGNSDVVYGGQYSGAVLKTANGGASWTSVPLPVPPGTNAQSVVTVAVNPTLSSDVWAGDAIGRIFRSDDGGGTWTFLSNVSLHNPSRMVFDGDTLYISDQGDNRSCATLICFDTTAPFGLVKTSDRGASWSTIMIGGNAIAVRGLAVLSGLVYAGGDINGDAFLERFDTNMGAQALAFGTYLGGGGFDKGVGVALDPSGNPVVAVETHSADFPTTLAASVTNTGVTRFTADGTTLLASSYVGGGGGLSMPTSVAVDADGNAYVAGGGGFNGLDDVAAWIDRVDPSGVDNASIALNGVSSNVGSPATIANGIAAGPTPGDVYVAGTTNTLDFPTTPGAPQPSFASGSSDAFISKVSFADDAPPSVSIIGPADGVTLPRGSAVTITGTTFEQRRPRR